eukprot:CAMPEP_0204276010 /NCGR_PEP_ID=MMETSP0468-20130131/27164_1 /ASSEMBLY_ACC=CAM_ASM_000383 /TAXON_ID=2969 /ORGANISM="Oxyrrhis marina" /LENGTH=32 /DNA_ID= /DNA_START= /DNA_END= /DNA_ORIENTATION=
MAVVAMGTRLSQGGSSADAAEWGWSRTFRRSA